MNEHEHFGPKSAPASADMGKEEQERLAREAQDDLNVINDLFDPAQTFLYFLKAERGENMEVVDELVPSDQMKQNLQESFFGVYRHGVMVIHQIFANRFGEAEDAGWRRDPIFLKLQKFLDQMDNTRVYTSNELTGMITDGGMLTMEVLVRYGDMFHEAYPMIEL